jgi:hypothetical protein
VARDASDEPGVGRDSTGVDPEDSLGSEAELEAIISHMTNDGSRLALVRRMPRAKKIYEALHPETAHGGDHTEQVMKIRTWPSFANYMADRVGLSAPTIYNMLDEAEELRSLDPQAEAASYGTPLANNKIGFVVRVCKIPQKELQRDLVTLYRASGPTEAKKALVKWEAEFKLAKPKPAKPEPGEGDLQTLIVLIAKVAAAVSEARKFVGMPIPALWKALLPLTVTQIKTGKITPEDAAKLLARRALCVRLETLRTSLKKGRAVAPTAEKFGVSAKTIDAAQRAQRLTVADVEELEGLYAQALAHVHTRTPIEDVLATPGTGKTTKATSTPAKSANAPKSRKKSRKATVAPRVTGAPKATATSEAKGDAKAGPVADDSDSLRRIRDGARGVG